MIHVLAMAYPGFTFQEITEIIPVVTIKGLMEQWKERPPLYFLFLSLAQSLGAFKKGEDVSEIDGDKMLMMLQAAGQKVTVKK